MPLLHRNPARRDSGPVVATDDLPDDALVVAARGNPRDFEPIFVRYWEPVLRYCTYRLAGRHDAEDVASQVFVEAYASLHRFHDRGRDDSFRSWLFTIARHQVIDRRRYAARHPASSLDDDVLGVDPATSPEQAAATAYDVAELIALVRALPDRPREVVELRLTGLSDREIAGVLGISGAAVRQAQSRAVMYLRTRMGVAPGAKRDPHD